MLKASTIQEVRDQISSCKSEGKIIALVPTMGALHEGHLKVIEHAKKENDFVVCSIFVNPLQFNSSSDFDKYPRDLEKDIQLLNEANCDLVFLPNEVEMYGKGTTLHFELGSIDTVLEGKYRPGHFSGVAVVVSKLFNIIQPHTAYFGQKDLQQVAVIRLITNDLSFQVDIKDIPTVRNKEGLALSSRNLRLSQSGIILSTNLYKTLEYCRTRLLTTHGVSWLEIKSEAIQKLEALKIRVEYLELVNKYTFEIHSQFYSNSFVNERSLHICIAVWVEEVRLIDNVSLIT